MPSDTVGPSHPSPFWVVPKAHNEASAVDGWYCIVHWVFLYIYIYIYIYMYMKKQNLLENKLELELNWNFNFIRSVPSTNLFTSVIEVRLIQI